MTGKDNKENIDRRPKKRNLFIGGRGPILGLVIIAGLLIIAALIIYPLFVMDEASTDTQYGGPAVGEAGRRMFEEAFRLEDQIELNAYHHGAKLKDDIIFRRATWWATIEEVEQAEDSNPDTVRTPQYIPEHLAELRMELPTVLAYMWSAGGAQASIEYQFGRKTKKLCGIVIAASLPPDITLADINGFLLKTGLIAEVSSEKPDRKIDLREHGFNYRQWNRDKTRLSLAWKDIAVKGRPRHTRVMIYCSPPGYGGEIYPLNYMNAAFGTYMEAVGR